MNEHDLIKALIRNFPRSRRQRGEPFTCDAELVEIGGQLWALTIDEFTPEEDLFSSDDPELLGANLATATLSDLLAAGAEPAFFMDAVSVPANADADFIQAFSAGMQAVLDEAGCFLCGGDVGVAESWRFCGFAMGPVPDGRPLTRIIPPSSQTLWVTGSLGDLNLAALEKQPTPRLELRSAQARVIRPHATACIDTSGGFLEAVWMLAAVSPEVRMYIDCDKLPLAAGMETFSKASGIPVEAALLGGAGEYELLFATPANLPESAEAELARAGATPVGSAEPHSRGGIYFRRNGKSFGTMAAPPPNPREAPSIDEHIVQVVQTARELFGSPGEPRK